MVFIVVNNLSMVLAESVVIYKLITAVQNVIVTAWLNAP